VEGLVHQQNEVTITYRSTDVSD